MNVGSSFSQMDQEENGDEEEEFVVDEHGEGLIEPQGGRSANYTVDADWLLCKTWLHIGMDPTVGTNQTKGTYWETMKEYFDSHNTSGNEGTERSLRSRWSIIDTDCGKWASALADVDRINPSGTGDVDRLTIAQNLFKDEGRRTKKGKKIHGKSFVVAHCYDEIKNEEKWKNRDGLDVHKIGMNATADATIIDSDASSDDNKRCSTPHLVANTKRPLLGKKAAKDT